jgi:toxin-antitoxin system PIN domain toxin
MIVPDVNVLINAARSGAPDHDLARRTLIDLLTGTEPVGVLDDTLTAVVRILSNPRLGIPQSPEDSLAFCDRVRTAPAVTRLVPPDSAWATFTASVQALDLRANDIPDAWLAAVVASTRATLMTFDRGFRRFEALDVTLLGA